MTPTQGTIRLARSLFLTSVVMVLATLAHVVGGGMVPGLGAVAVGSAVVTSAAYVLSRRRLRTPAILGFLGAGQVLLHELFGAGAHAMTMNSTSVNGMSMDGMSANGAVQGLSDGGTSPAMLLGHAVATVLCSVVLQRAERALWVIAAFVDSLLRVLVPVLQPRVRPTPAVAYAPVHAHVRLFRHNAHRRGPPATVTV